MIPPVDHAQNFPEDVFLGVSLECLLGDEDVWSPVLEYRLKSAITFDATVGSPSNFYRGCVPWSSMKCLLGDEDVWSLVLEYWLKNAITFDSIVDHPQTFTEAVFLGVATK